MSPYSPIPQVVSIPGPQRRGTGGTPSSSFGKATGTGGTRPESDRPPSGRPLLLRKSAAGSVAPTGLFGSLGVVPRTSCWANFLAADPAQAKLGRGTPQSFPGLRVGLNSSLPIPPKQSLDGAPPQSFPGLRVGLTSSLPIPPKQSLDGAPPQSFPGLRVGLTSSLPIPPKQSLDGAPPSRSQDIAAYFLP